MCEFCTIHGEGKKWYENASNYSSEVFHRVNSGKNLKSFLSGLSRSLSEDVPLAFRWKTRYPRIYDFIVFPYVTRRLKKVHFGQIVPVEDVGLILERSSSIVRLPCVCRKASLGVERRYCFGIGMDLRPIYKSVPDFSDFEEVTSEEAKAFIRDLDAGGKVHSIWTLNTPFIGGLCNCDQDCMAFRFERQMKLGRAMWKAEYVASFDPDLCTGCRECMKRCFFGAIRYDRANVKCSADVFSCYGCGLCRNACNKNAIMLRARHSIAEAATAW